MLKPETQALYDAFVETDSNIAFRRYWKAVEADGEVAARAAHFECAAAAAKGRTLPPVKAVLYPDNAPENRWNIRYRAHGKGAGAPIQSIYAGPTEADARAAVAKLEAMGDRILYQAASWRDPAAPRCHVCDAPFGDDEDGGEVPRQSLKNAGFMAKRNANGEIAAEACELCAQEIEEECDDEM